MLRHAPIGTSRLHPSHHLLYAFLIGAVIGHHGHRLTVVVVGRAAGSGTAAVIEDRILHGRALTSNARLLDTHESVIDAVGSTHGAVGYADAHLAQARASEVKLVAVSARSDEPAHLPGPEAIAHGKYPLARRSAANSTSSWAILSNFGCLSPAAPA